tara:strand:- start:44 stop:238 length:195 start_codon:yes stop_codon:yes gene_type:complete
MNKKSSQEAVLQAGSESLASSKSLQLASAFLLGFVLLFGAGFIQTSVAHNAAHDVRHSLAFPCH